MIKVQTFKMPWDTRHFNKGQKVFVEIMSGAQACKVRGKFRGSGRRVSVWFKWSDKTMYLINIKSIEISESDYNNIFKQ